MEMRSSSAVGSLTICLESILRTNVVFMVVHHLPHCDNEDDDSLSGSGIEGADVNRALANQLAVLVRTERDLAQRNIGLAILMQDCVSVVETADNTFGNSVSTFAAMVVVVCWAILRGSALLITSYRESLCGTAATNVETPIAAAILSLLTSMHTSAWPCYACVLVQLFIFFERQAALQRIRSVAPLFSRDVAVYTDGALTRAITTAHCSRLLALIIWSLCGIGISPSVTFFGALGLLIGCDSAVANAHDTIHENDGATDVEHNAISLQRWMIATRKIRPPVDRSVIVQRVFR